MKKAELRNKYKILRRKLPVELRQQYELSIVEQIVERIQGYQHIGIFLPIEKYNEIDLTPLLHNKAFNWYVPIANFTDNTMYFVSISKETPLETVDFDIKQPIDKNKIESQQIDVLIVPLLISDKRGYRVGYGKGFYDQYIKRCKPDCLKIGVNLFEPIAEISDITNFDEKLDLVIIPKNCKN